MDETGPHVDDGLQAFLSGTGRASNGPDIEAVCPMCGGKNSGIATECHACGEPLSPVSLASAFDVYRDGKLLVMHKYLGKLPYRCIKTNTEADMLLRQKLRWHHPLVYLCFCATRACSSLWPCWSEKGLTLKSQFAIAFESVEREGSSPLGRSASSA